MVHLHFGLLGHGKEYFRLRQRSLLRVLLTRIWDPFPGCELGAGSCGKTGADNSTQHAKMRANTANRHLTLHLPHDDGLSGPLPKRLG